MADYLFEYWWKEKALSSYFEINNLSQRDYFKGYVSIYLPEINNIDEIDSLYSINLDDTVFYFEDYYIKTVNWYQVKEKNWVNIDNPPPKKLVESDLTFRIITDSLIQLPDGKWKLIDNILIKTS